MSKQDSENPADVQETTVESLSGANKTNSGRQVSMNKPEMTEEEMIQKTYLDVITNKFKDYSNLDLVERALDQINEITLRVYQEEWDAEEVSFFIETQMQSGLDLLKERLNGK